MITIKYRSIFLYLFFNLLVLPAVNIQAVVVWNAVAAPDVIDDDLIINGNVQLKLGSNIIRAQTQDVNVSVISNSQVRGNDAGPSQLYVCAAAGRTVHFTLDSFDLAFVGSSDANQTPLLIIFGDFGTTRFTLRGNRTISFTKTMSSGGTQAYLHMEIPAGVIQPTLIFEREMPEVNPSGHATLAIGEESLLSYLSRMAVPFAADQAQIIFNGTNGNANPGRLVMDIADTGAFIIAGSLTTQMTKTLITLADIDRTTAAGMNALMRTINTDLNNNVQSSLLVTNRNETFFDLLVDPFKNLGAALDATNFKGSFSGVRYGFVLGANGEISIEEESYLDYVGLSNNNCPPQGVDNPLIKSRNASAFFVDGNLNPLSTPAKINMAELSGLFFRSGVNSNNEIRELSHDHPFTVQPLLQTPDSPGNFVFDVEGLLTICGSNVGNLQQSKIELLSLEVDPTGGPLFLDGSELNFPIRTGETDCGIFLAYNKAAFMINNCFTIIDASLVHSDVNHRVCEKDDINSEPTYVGGEFFRLHCFVDRPKIAFCNSRFLIHTDVAFTGLDLLVSDKKDPLTDMCESNTSKFVFFSNGRCVDQGTGRQFNLGTLIGSKGCDDCTIVSPDAHLDIIPHGSCANDVSSLLNQLILTTSFNTTDMNPCIDDRDIEGQNSIHSIFLGHSSNISVGFDITCTSTVGVTPSRLLVCGNFFAFETRGGKFGRPDLGGITGEGVILVDFNGKLAIDPNARMSVALSVLKRTNGQVCWPKNQALFGCRVGVTDWCLDLAQTMTLVKADECFSDYTLNWRLACKDCENFVPYELESVNLCECPAVTQQNLEPLPIIAGEVSQLQIQGSRLGDQAHVVVDGGFVRELVFQKGNSAGDAPTGVVIVRNEARVGLNTAHRNVDSVEAQIVLGANGVTIIADGSGTIILNEDVIVTNVCSILKGPNFTSMTQTVTGDILRIDSDLPHEFRIKSGAVLDLRTFGEGDAIEFCGQVSVILEPGAQIIMNGVRMRFVDATCMICEPLPKSLKIFDSIPLGPINNALSPLASTPSSMPHNQFAPLTGHGVGLANTDPFRVKLLGNGRIELAERSCFFVPRFTYLGIETLFKEVLSVPNAPLCCTMQTVTCQDMVTSITVSVQDSGLFAIGDNDTDGGSIQIGNTQSRAGHSVNFTLEMFGHDARFIIKPEGFLGFAVGIVDKRTEFPDGWLVDTLFDVSSITVTVIDGVFRHDRIFTGSSVNASLWAIGRTSTTAPLYTLGLEPTPIAGNERLTNANIQGGGNLALISSSSVAGNPGAISPIVQSDDNLVDVGGGVDHPRLRVGILNSANLLPDPSPIAVGPDAYFNYLMAKNFLDTDNTPIEALGKAMAAFSVPSFDEVRSPLRVGWVFADRIGRADMLDLADAFGGTMDDRRQRAADVGAVGPQVDLNGPVFLPSGRLAFAQQLE